MPAAITISLLLHCNSVQLVAGALAFKSGKIVKAAASPEVHHPKLCVHTFVNLLVLLPLLQYLVTL